ESARNGEIPKFQKPLFGTTPPSALSGLVVQTFPNAAHLRAKKSSSADGRSDENIPQSRAHAAI
ncbi:hypothetical protein, partial [Xanthomonas citri]|uniref:hypothetical protein n=1 Tax=Xanthomonas citri TaxID=346 RepID=UPI00103DAA28